MSSTENRWAMIHQGQVSTRTSARREPSQVSARAVAREVFPTPVATRSHHFDQTLDNSEGKLQGGSREAPLKSFKRLEENIHNCQLMSAVLEDHKEAMKLWACVPPASQLLPVPPPLRPYELLLADRKHVCATDPKIHSRY